MTEQKWDMQRIRQEIYDARTKLFVVAKILETGNLTFSENPEWALVVDPLLKEVTEQADKIKEFVKSGRP